MYQGQKAPKGKRPSRFIEHSTQHTEPSMSKHRTHTQVIYYNDENKSTVKAIERCLYRVQWLDLSGCDKITDNGWAELVDTLRIDNLFGEYQRGRDYSDESDDSDDSDDN